MLKLKYKLEYTIIMVGEIVNKIINDIKDIIRDIGGDAYIVGGYIRDKLLQKNKEFKDLDIVYDGDIHFFIRALESKGYKIFPIKEDIKIYRAVIEDKILDIALLNGNNIEEDLQSRDFTINAIALKLISNNIIDPFRGRDHIRAKIIHEVKEDSIQKDRIRILRGCRFAIKYGMHFSKLCEEHIRRENKYIKFSPKERIFNELIEILKVDDNGIAFEELDKYGVLKELLPYIDELKTVGKCKYHIEDAFTHMNLVYRNSKELLRGELKVEGLDLDIFKVNLGEVSIGVYFSLAAFCHDIGKVKCYRNNDGKISFIGHDKEGAKIIEEALEVLGFPKKAQKFIKALVEAHMYPLGLCKNNVKNYKRSFYKFFSRYDEYVPYILAISYCDMHATKMLYDPDNEEQMFNEYIENLLKEYKLYKNVKDNRFINGKEIIEVTGLKGKNIGKVLEELDKKAYYEEIITKEDALKYLKSISHKS
ncbi:MULTISPECIES: HD domain-containing protein [Clostridium]|uniref:Multifunctional CCA protein n=1 Tax=Clostridium colicanis DSM 13634 TaxID=1121305 RepID=A0A151APY9_9CLOT|nr:MULTISPECIES: HD domain-containing protein [Clostridium]KYH29685.1 multifunctional CCA protein [Clostridium colicanis DSM 13634]